MSDHDELESSVPAWVLGALDDEEADSVRTHIEGCAACREVEARLRRVVGALPLVVEEVAPPGRLRERVLAAAAATETSPRPVARPRRVRPPRPPLASRVPLYAVAAIAVIALLAGLLVGETFRAPQPAPAQVARFQLTGHQEMSGAQAGVIDLRSDGLALVDFRRLPQAGTGRVYEVWLIKNGNNPEPVAVFVPDSNGARVVLVSRSLAGYSVMAVTNEPGPDGSTSPTQQPQLYGNVA